MDSLDRHELNQDDITKSKWNREYIEEYANQCIHRNGYCLREFFCDTCPWGGLKAERFTKNTEKL